MSIFHKLSKDFSANIKKREEPEGIFPVCRKQAHYKLINPFIIKKQLPHFQQHHDPRNPCRDNPFKHLKAGYKFPEFFPRISSTKAVLQRIAHRYQMATQRISG